MVLSSSTRTRISSWTMARTCTSLRMPRRPPTTCSLLSAASSALRAAGVRSTTSRWERRSGGVFDDASAAHCGVLKSGLQAIEADVRFRAIGCERPWHGFIIDDVLYMYATEFYGNEHSFRNAVMALMELAEDVLQCESVIVALPKVLSPPPIVTQQGAVIPQQHLDTAAAASLVRAFLYSGFEMVSPMLYQPSPAYVLVGYDAM
ncbi:hypothetical protein GQ54DRAFT_211222 [Martensiomyces pterosporus]|nr:hypothetical protein GQ54DRAFT_211222 [Martensiomyces pterosporus]